MAQWTETSRYSLQHLREDVDPRVVKFIAFRHLRCVMNHESLAGLWFTSFGHRLLNPEVLDCPVCGRECAVVG